MLDFTAIDFETATPSRCSPCSIGVAIVKDGKVVNAFQRLIKPHRDFRCFSAFNTYIHGITEDDVKDAPEFDTLWDELSPYLSNSVIVAHNTSFDCSVLCRTLDLYEIPRPICDTLCSVGVSRMTWPDLSSHTLNVVAALLEIPLQHHDAGSDAAASANIILKACEKTHVDSLRGLVNELNFDMGYIEKDDFWNPQAPRKRQIQDVVSGKWRERLHEELPLRDVDIVFTGTLMSMTREEAFAVVRLAGGRPRTSVSVNTEYLVLGVQDYCRFVDGKKSTKTKTAEALQADGCPIEILSENDFLELIDWDLRMGKKKEGCATSA